MASNLYYIYDLPYSPRQELCRILDADKKWEKLGGEHMSVDVTTLTLIGQAVLRDKSPTSELLNLFSERNGSIKQLFVMLAKMDHQRAMTILLPYVEKKYHVLIKHGSATNAACDQNENLSKPDSSMSLLSGMCKEHCTISNTLLLEASTRDTRVVGQSSILSKVANKALNLNQGGLGKKSCSKLNCLNPHFKSCQARSKSPNLRNLKAGTKNCEESNTDNCVSEKIKNVRKISQASQAEAQATAADQASLEKSLPDVMKISYVDIELATDNFDKSRILGTGGFGKVYRGEWKGTSVAIKRLMPREGHDSSTKRVVSLKQSLNELNVLKCCRFDHILPLYGVSLDGSEPCLVYQLMINGSLEDRLLCRNGTLPLTWSQRSSIAECTAKGLNYLHTTPGKSLVHGDIKSANILLDSNMEAKIGDFGLTREGPGNQATHVKVSKLHGTECYLPPEYLRYRQLSPQVDVYCYGIVLFETATGLRPYDTKREDARLLLDYVSDCQVSGRLDSLRDPKAGEENMMWFGELIKIGQECSNKEKKKRPTMLHVLECFEKIKEEISMVDRIRRMSNDKSSLGDTSKLQQLTPKELQIFYDMCKEKYGATGPNVTSVRSTNVQLNQDNEPSLATAGTGRQHQLAANEDISRKYTGGVVNKSIALNQDDQPYVVPETSTDAGSQSQSSTQNDNTSSSTSGEQLSNGKAPIPLLTVLQLRVSEVNDHMYTNLTKSERSESNVSTEFSSEYSEDSVL